ncbi:MAG: hypothetical protein ACFE96_13325 [Candidatus Hermodarchaeota archaeon]
MKLKVNKNNNDNLIPEQIKDNISSTETVLFQTNWHYTSKFYKISIYSVLVMMIFTVISFLYAILRGSEILGDFWSIFLIVLPLAFITFLFTFRKSRLRKEFFLVITNEKIHMLMEQGRVTSVDSIRLTSIKSIIFKKKWTLRKNRVYSKIILITDDLKRYQKNKIVLQNIQNLPDIYKRLESILWNYANIRERIHMLYDKHRIKLPFIFKIEQKTFQRYTRYRSIVEVLFIISIIVIGMGIVFIFLNFEFIVNLGFLLFGSAFAVMFLVYRTILNNLITPKDNQLILEKDKINLKRGEGPETLYFNELVYLDFHQTQDLKKSPTGSFEVVGAIVIKESLNSSKKIKFGPIFDFYKFLEIIYLHILNWKGEKGFILGKEQIQDIMTKVEPKISQTIVQEPIMIKLEESYIDDEIMVHVQNYLESDEKIVFTYKPIVNLTRQIFFSILAIFSFILLYLSIQLSYTFNSINIFVITIFTLIFPIAYGMVALCSLPGIIMEKKTLYIFTNQKMIIKFPKQFVITKINNIASINRTNRRKKYHLQINLKAEISNSPYIDKSSITIQNIPKENNLLEKMKYLREKMKES